MNRKARRAQGKAKSLPNTFSIEHKLREALAHHQAGRLADAVQGYWAIVDADPENADAHKWLGVIAYQAGDHKAATDFLERALALRPSAVDTHNNYAVALIAAGREDDAEGALKRAIELNPHYADAFSNLGGLLRSRGRLSEAAQLLQRAVLLKPAHPDAHYNLGLCLRNLARDDDAEKHLRESLRLRPRSYEALTELAEIQIARRQFDQAAATCMAAMSAGPGKIYPLLLLADIECARSRPQAALTLLESAQRMKPSDPSDVMRLGLAFAKAGAPEKGLKELKEGVRKNPDDVKLLCNFAHVLMKEGRFPEARQIIDTAYAVAPDDLFVLNNLGVLLTEEGDYHRAIEFYRRSESLYTVSPEFSLNMGSALLAVGDAHGALGIFQTVCSVRPQNADAHYGVFLAQASLGNLPVAWDEHEWRWRQEKFPSMRRHFGQPAWNGSDNISDQRLLIYREQGIGDEILFASCIPEIVAQAQSVVIEASAKMVPLFTRSFPQTQVLIEDGSRDQTRDDFDRHIAMGSLPRACRRDLAAFPDRPGFLIPDPERVAYWRQRLAALGAGPMIGLGWRSRRVKGTKNHQYWATLPKMAEFAMLPGVTYINLQYDRDEEEIALARELGFPLVDFPEIDLTDDIDEVAALTKACDGVLSVATAVALLAGAVGTPTFSLWLEGNWQHLGTEHNPWFPSMRCYRRASGAEWDSAIATAAADIAQHFSGRKAG